MIMIYGLMSFEENREIKFANNTFKYHNKSHGYVANFKNGRVHLFKGVLRFGKVKRIAWFGGYSQLHEYNEITVLETAFNSPIDAFIDVMKLLKKEAKRNNEFLNDIQKSSSYQTNLKVFKDELQHILDQKTLKKAAEFSEEISSREEELLVKIKEEKLENERVVSTYVDDETVKRAKEISEEIIYNESVGTEYLQRSF